MPRLLDTKVKVISEAEWAFAGQSQFSNYEGWLPALDAMLVDGFGAVPITGVSVREDSEDPAYWLCSITTEKDAGDIKFMPVIEIKGNNEAALNKQHRVQEAQGKVLTIALLKSEHPTKPTEQPGGVISFPSLGWTKQWENDTVRVYRIGDSRIPNFFLRIEPYPPLDKIFRARAYTHMDNIDDTQRHPKRLIMPQPDEDCLVPILRPGDTMYTYWNERGIQEYLMVGDEKTFHWIPRAYHSTTPFSFGCYKPFKKAPVIYPFITTTARVNGQVSAGARDGQDQYFRDEPSYVFNRFTSYISGWGYTNYYQQLRGFPKRYLDPSELTVAVGYLGEVVVRDNDTNRARFLFTPYIVGNWDSNKGFVPYGTMRMVMKDLGGSSKVVGDPKPRLHADPEENEFFIVYRTAVKNDLEIYWGLSLRDQEDWDV